MWRAVFFFPSWPLATRGNMADWHVFSLRGRKLRWYRQSSRRASSLVHVNCTSSSWALHLRYSTVRPAARTSLQDDRIRALYRFASPRDAAVMSRFCSVGRGPEAYFIRGGRPFGTAAFLSQSGRRACESRICLRNDLGTESLACAPAVW